MKNTEEAFKWIVNMLNGQNIVYKITGGFAARIYGVNRELADIDIEISERDISNISERVKDFITRKPERYIDNNWDITLMTLNYKGQDIDISAIEGKIFNKKDNKWEDCPNDLSKTNQIEVYGKNVSVESIDALISYKKKLARDVDMDDVRQLLEIKKQGGI